MAGIADIRAKFPQYSDMSDAQLADAVHKKFYADMPKADFDAKLGIATDPNAQAVAAGVPVADPNAPGADGNSNAPLPPMMMYGNNTKGLLTPGNTDLNRRPIVKNPDGSISTVRSMSFENNKGQEVLIPTVADDGSRILSNKEAMEQYGRTGKHLGIFDNPDDATAYAESLHEQQDQAYAGGRAPTGGPSPAFQDALAQLHAASSGIQKAPQEDTDRNVRANLEATKINEMKGPFFKGMSDSADAAAGGAGFNFADELYSGLVGAPMRMLTEGTGYGEGYKRSQALQAALEKKRNPVANIVGQVGGGLATGGKLAQMGITTAGRSIPLLSQAAPKTASTLLAGLEGAGYGGAYGLGQGEGMERIDNAITGAKIGGLTGGALQVGGNLLGSAAARKAAPATQTAEDLAQQGSALYKSAKDAGVTVKPSAMNNAAGNVTLKLKSFGFDKDLQPKTAVVARKLLEARNKPLDLAEVDNIRKMAVDIVREGTAAKSDREAAGLIIEQIDNMIDNSANFSANSSQGLDAIKAAREVWKRKAKTETIEDIVDRAQNQATGFENGLVSQLRSLANNKNKMRAFSKAEQKMIKSVVRRGTVHGALRALGMLAPNSTFGGLVTGGTLAGSGILPGVGLAAAGSIAKAGAGALTRAKVNTLQRAVSTGQLPQLALPKNVNPFIGGATQATQGSYQLLSK